MNHNSRRSGLRTCRLRANEENHRREEYERRACEKHEPDAIKQPVSTQSEKFRATRPRTNDESTPPPSTPTRILKTLYDSTPGISHCNPGFPITIIGVYQRSGLVLRSRAMSAIPAIPTPPPGLFSTFVTNKALSYNRPLGLPCVTLGPRLGHPRATHR